MRWLILLVVISLGLGLAMPLLERIAGQAGLLRDKTRPAGAAPAAGTLYRWRDANGTLHIESSPPPAGVSAEAVKWRASTPAPPAAAPARAGSKPSLADNPLSVYSPGGIEALMETLDETLRKLDEHKSDARALENQL